MNIELLDILKTKIKTAPVRIVYNKGGKDYFGYVDKLITKKSELKFTSCLDNSKIILSIDDVKYFAVYDSVERINTEISDIKALQSKLKSFQNPFINIDEYLFQVSVDRNKLHFAARFLIRSLDDISNESVDCVNALRFFWRKEIKIAKQQALDFLDKEIEQCVVDTDKEVLTDIRNEVNQYDPDSEISAFTKCEQFINFWPTLLLPGPDFITEFSMHNGLFVWHSK